MRNVLILFTITFFSLSAKSQNYNNIVNYHVNGTPAYGAKIKTNLPFTNSNHMPTIKIEGYSHVDDTNINLTLSWYIFNSKFARMVMSSYGGITPDVWLANENGKVVIYLDMKMYYQRFTVSAFAQGMSEKPEYFTSWTVVDEALSGTEQTLVPYKNKFKTITTDGDISIGEHVEKTGLGGKLHLRGTANNSDHLWLAKYVRSNDQTDMRVNIGDYNNGDRFVIGSQLSDSWGELFTVSTLGTGRVGIGVSFPTCALDVNGTIRSKEVKVEATGWADFVFEEDYKLPSLHEVESHIKAKGTLPDIPSEQEVKKNGVNLGEMQVKLLQKIEELTLYMIELKKENEKLQKRVNQLENK